ncbi:protein translocase subunit SecD [Patescibacteria group bacterium]|nr:protein translocase subunit SecD [Patescibacteria group bacterium]
MQKNTFLFTILIIVIAVIAALVTWPSGPDLNISQLDLSKELKIHQGLDLKGGTQLTYQADINLVPMAEREEALQGVINIIDFRINQLGVAEPLIQTSGQDKIIVELPGVNDISQAINLIGKTAQLQFKDENPESDPNLSQADPDWWQETPLTGANLKKADIEIDPQSQKPIVTLEFNDEGKELFAKLTKENLNKRIAIFLDNILISAPTVQAEITDGSAIIEGDFTVEDAKELKIQLNSGALPVPVKLIAQSNIGATLGNEAMQKSLVAGLIGLILIIIFLLLNYRLPGLLASIALFLYILISISIFKLVPVTITLAGAAAFILSIGMAVDANILIFERSKEELREGKSLQSAIESGFLRAWPSIRDANFSTLITCLILWFVGTGTIRGFALTLAIGVLVSMFSAITITRTFLRIFLGNNDNPQIFGIKVKK